LQVLRKADVALLRMWLGLQEIYDVAAGHATERCNARAETATGRTDGQMEELKRCGPPSPRLWRASFAVGDPLSRSWFSIPVGRKAPRPKGWPASRSSLSTPASEGWWRRRESNPKETVSLTH
jgi:hypothetical protein